MMKTKDSKPKLKWSKPEYKTVSSEQLKKIIASGACSTLTLPDCQYLFR